MSGSPEAAADPRLGRHTRAVGRPERLRRTGGFIRSMPSRRRAALMTGCIVGVLGFELVLIAPYAHRAAGQLTHARWTWLLAAMACETVSMVMFARLQRHALGTGVLRVRLGSAVATVFAGNAVGATLPGGSLLSIAYRTRRMRAWGASASQIGFVHAATGVLSTIALASFAGAGHIVAGDGSQLISVAVQVGVICVITCAALALVHHPVLLRRPAHALLRLVPRLRRRTAARASVDRLLDELAALRPPARFWLWGLGLAVFNCCGDFLCLLAVCHAVGVSPPLSTALFAYLAGMTAASAVPLLPAGIGVLDAALVLTLHHGGVPVGAATAADLLYRSITPGLVSVAGWALLLQQRRRPDRPRHPRETGGTPEAGDHTGGVAGPSPFTRKT